MSDYGRVKTWGNEVLQPTDLNAEFDNIITNTNNLNSANLDMTATYAWSGAHTHTATVTIGVDDTGHDFKVFGATTAKSLLWDESADTLIIAGKQTISETLGVTGVLTATAQSVHTGGIQVGGNIVSDTDSTDDLGTTGVRWANLWVDSIVATDTIAATSYTGALLTAVTAVTQSDSNNSTKVATTAYVDSMVGGVTSGAALTGSTNNTLTTVTGANAIQGEANLTFDGALLTANLANVAATASPQAVQVYSSDAMAIDKGGSLGLGGFYDGSTQISFANIGGRKENGTNANTDGYLVFSTLENGVGMAERMRIDSSGHVGINNTAMDTYNGNTTALVIGNVSMSSGASSSISLAAPTNGYGSYEFTDTAATASQGGVFYNHNNDSLNFKVNSVSYAMELTNTGKVIHNATTGGDSFDLVMSHATIPYGMNLYMSGASPDDNAQYFFLGRDTTTARIFIYSDGDLQNHDNSYGGISDVKLKTDIVDARDYWDDFKQVQFRKFKFLTDIDQYGDDATSRFGVIAQEIETVFPNLIKESPDMEDREVDTGEVDENGDAIMKSEKVDLGTTTKGVKYSVLSQIGLKVIQELQARVEALEAV